MQPHCVPSSCNKSSLVPTTSCSLTPARPPGEVEAQAGHAAELEAELAAARQLAGRLEEDLLQAQDAASAAAAPGFGAGTGGAGDVAGEGSTAGEGGAGAADGTGGGAEGRWEPMVAVLSSQRDRFRARAQEVEAQLATLGQELKRVRCTSVGLKGNGYAVRAGA